MTKKSKRPPFKILAYAVFLFLLYVLQASVFSKLPISGARPVILPLAVVGTAIFEGSVKGGVTGLFAGMLCDISFNQPPVQFTLILTLVGVVIGVACDTLFARGFPTYIIAGAETIVVCALTQAFGPVFLYDFEFSVLRHIMIFQCVYSMLFLLPVYIVVRSISRIPGAS